MLSIVIDISPTTATLLHLIQVPVIIIQIWAVLCISKKVRHCSLLWLTTTFIGLMWIWVTFNPPKEWIFALTIGSMMNSTLIILWGWLHYGENGSAP
jgi:hypothetical protein